MRAVTIIESFDSSEEKSVLEKHSWMLNGYNEWCDDMKRNPFLMKDASYKASRYRNHLLYSKDKSFPFSGFYASQTHKDEKAFRVVWKIVYSNVPNQHTDNLDILEESVSEQVKTLIQSNLSEGTNTIIVFVAHSCIDYHDSSTGMPLEVVDSVLTAFENNYKKYHKGKMPDSRSLLGRLAELVEKIF